MKLQLQLPFRWEGAVREAGEQLGRAFQMNPTAKEVLFMPVPDPKLAALIQYARKATPEKAPCFAVVVKGGTDGALVVSRRKVPPKSIQEARLRCGGTAVFLGRCFQEEGKLVFETVKKTPGTLARLLRTIIARETGLKLHVLARQGVALAEDAVEGADSEDETPPSDTSEQLTDLPEAPPKKFSPVTYGHTRLLWDATRKRAHRQLQQLQQAIVARSADDPRLAEITEKVKALDNVLLNLDEGLSDTLDAALNAQGEQRDQLHREAAKLIAKYMAYVRNDILFNSLDENPFFPVTVRNDMATTLATLASKLGC